MSTTQLDSCLVASGNTYNPSLLVLRQKGYELWLEKGENASLWCAKKGDQSFLAYTGPELLGLITLWEHLGENWNQQKPDIYSELLEKGSRLKPTGPAAPRLLAYPTCRSGRGCAARPEASPGPGLRRRGLWQVHLPGAAGAGVVWR
jgi:hypothetical protein